MMWCLERRARRMLWLTAGLMVATSARVAPTRADVASSNALPVIAAAAVPTNAAVGVSTGLLAGIFSEELETNATAVAAWADLADIWRKTPDADASPVENLTLPIEHYENGRVRAVLHAGKASVGRGGLIWSWQVRVDLFSLAGQEDGHVEAESCLYDRNARRGYCPENVRLVRTNATVSGVGMYWSMADQRMRILTQPVVEMEHGARLIPGGKSK